MELKNYQQRVLNNLRSFARRYAARGDARQAYHEYLLEDGIPDDGTHMYHDVLGVRGDGTTVPKVCVKVPTGGGKTFIAANAISVIADELPESLNDVVVWLVPRNEILRQTIRKLRNPDDPLRVVLDRDFAHRVEVLDKESGLRGVGFNSATIDDQLTLFVLSYDSFKNTKDGRRAYQENSALMQLTSYQRAAGMSVAVEGADDTALITALAGTNPIIVVDESHHAGSDLSVEMLKNLNPRFVLELTATPTDDANIISRVTARELKAEQMVKLPVIVYRRSSKVDVIQDAVMLQRRLEEVAKKSEAQGGRYIRPIVLFQAEPRGNDDNETYQKLKGKLVDAGIPEEQVAIRTGDVDELGDTNLLARSCPIRYIITVEALSEGWDCPFAYVLATVSNKNSKMSVEQIVGRILRQPYASRSAARCLNISYVLTSAPNLNQTVDQVIAGLNGQGFSKADVQAPDLDKGNGQSDPQPDLFGNEGESNSDEVDESTQTDDDSEYDDDFDLEFPDGNDDNNGSDDADAHDPIGDILNDAEEAEEEYDSDKGGEGDKSGDKTGLGGDMSGYHVRASVADTLSGLALPRFMTKEDAGLFTLDFGGGNESQFERSMLLSDFNLSSCATTGIVFDYTGYDRARQVDVDEESDVFKMRTLSNVDIDVMRGLFANYSTESKRKAIIIGIYDRMTTQFKNLYGEKALHGYITRAVGDMSNEQMDAYIDNAGRFARSIMTEIDRLSDEHCHTRFMQWLDSGRVYLSDTYRFPGTFHTGSPVTKYDRTLYEAEDGGMNGLEFKMAEALANCTGIRWWHRVVEQRDGEFSINGFVNHYPDFVAMTSNGRIFAIETKGEHLKNEDTARKLELGKKWADLAGQNYRYFMVFENDSHGMNGAYTLAGFKMTILGQL